MDCVEHHHSLGNFGSIIAKSAAFGIASPDFECGFHDLNHG
jgi:hypothetical protein